MHVLLTQILLAIDGVREAPPFELACRESILAQKKKKIAIRIELTVAI